MYESMVQFFTPCDIRRHANLVAFALFASYCMVSAHDDDLSMLKAEIASLKAESASLKSRLLSLEASNRSLNRRSLKAADVVSYCYSQSIHAVADSNEYDDYYPYVLAEVTNLGTVKVDKGDALKINFEFTSGAILIENSYTLDDDWFTAYNQESAFTTLKPVLTDAKGARYYPMPDARLVVGNLKYLVTPNLSDDDWTFMSDLDYHRNLITGYFYFLDLPKGTYTLTLIAEIKARSYGNTANDYYPFKSALFLGPHVVEIEKVANMNNQCSAKVYYDDDKIADDDRYIGLGGFLGTADKPMQDGKPLVASP